MRVITMMLIAAAVVMLATALVMVGPAQAQQWINGQNDYYSVMRSHPGHQNMVSHWQALRSFCRNNDPARSVRIGGDRAPTTDVDLTCYRHNVCRGTLHTADGYHYSFDLRCR